MWYLAELASSMCPRSFERIAPVTLDVSLGLSLFAVNALQCALIPSTR